MGGGKVYLTQREIERSEDGGIVRNHGPIKVGRWAASNIADEKVDIAGAGTAPARKPSLADRKPIQNNSSPAQGLADLPVRRSNCGRLTVPPKPLRG